MFGPSCNTVGTDPFPAIQLHYACHQAYRLRYMNYFGLDRCSYQKSVVLQVILGQAMKTKILLPAPNHTQKPDGFPVSLRRQSALIPSLFRT